MEKQFEYFNQLIQATSLYYIRPLIQFLEKPNRLVGIKGARGVGKTTLLLQYAKQSLPLDQSTLYISLDDPLFLTHSLVDFSSDFVKYGGRTLLIDEVHRYPSWSRELKFIYDSHPQLRIIFTGSSVLHIDSSTADLSRRAVIRTLYGLSFREYLNWNYDLELKSYTLEEIIKSSNTISHKVVGKIKPLSVFDEYLKLGYYPYSIENSEFYLEKLRETARIAIESDIRSYHELGPDMVLFLIKFLSILADSVPFIPNISKLSQRIGTSRNTIIKLLHLLEDAQLIHRLYRQSSGITRLQKPDKVFLNDTNLMHALSWSEVNRGALRETFFVSQVRQAYPIRIASQGDFVVNDKFTFEVGGPHKKQYQIVALRHAYIVADGIEYPVGQKIPLWQFGLVR
ncbi:ATP-binding protein [Membranicola marinus]|uniref:ATP-binding protein n=1 Tax=Membranihabitans marinus TaxID=1227546 RepID=A0A953HR86_9BACT|nr:ATP-binding protein [Membranihabitans marinus]MBY5960277.1 ATP-binding protein [Membranihabitans marinus]